MVFLTVTALIVVTGGNSVDMEDLLVLLASIPFLYIGFGIFCIVWFYSFKWFFVFLVSVGEKFFKKNSWPYNIYMTVFVGGGGLGSIYFLIWLFIWIAKENGY